MTDKTVKQHLIDSDALARTIADANAMVVKLQRALSDARESFETLAKWQHPKLMIGPLYGSVYAKDHNGKCPDSLSGEAVALANVKRINEILGDRV